MTSLLRIAVPTEPKVIQLEIDRDPRLAKAAGGVAHFMANAAGFEPAAAEELQSAVVAACLSAFEQLPNAETRLRIAVSQWLNRVEVSLYSAKSADPLARLSRSV